MSVPRLARLRPRPEENAAAPHRSNGSETRHASGATSVRASNNRIGRNTSEKAERAREVASQDCHTQQKKKKKKLKNLSRASKKGIGALGRHVAGKNRTHQAAEVRELLPKEKRKKKAGRRGAHRGALATNGKPLPVALGTNDSYR